MMRKSYKNKIVIALFSMMTLSLFIFTSCNSTLSDSIVDGVLCESVDGDNIIDYGEVFSNDADSLLNRKSVSFDSLPSLLMALSSHKVNRAIIDKSTAQNVCEKNDKFEYFSKDIIATANYSMCFLKEREELCNKISLVIKEIKKNGKLDELIKLYIDTDEGEPILKLPKFEGAETVDIAITGDLPPMDYIDSNGMPQGFNIALLSYISNELKININTVNLDSGGRVPSLATGKVDGIFWKKSIKFKDNTYNVDNVPDSTITSESYFETPLAEVFNKGEMPPVYGILGE